MPYRKYFVKITENSKVQINEKILKTKNIELLNKIQPFPTINPSNNVHSYKINSKKYTKNLFKLIEVEEKILLNDFATRSFREIADQDYIAARLSYRHGLYPQFHWQSLQAIEKHRCGGVTKPYESLQGNA